MSVLPSSDRKIKVPVYVVFAIYISIYRKIKLQKIHIRYTLQTMKTVFQKPQKRANKNKFGT